MRTLTEIYVDLAIALVELRDLEKRVTAAIELNESGTEIPDEELDDIDKKTKSLEQKINILKNEVLARQEQSHENEG